MSRTITNLVYITSVLGLTTPPYVKAREQTSNTKANLLCMQFNTLSYCLQPV